MSDKTDDPKTAGRPAVVPIIHRDVIHAPIIYFEAAPNFGNNNGIINVTLSAGRSIPAEDGSITTDAVVVAYLRCNAQAALHLRNAIDDALLLGVPTQGQTQ